jgi:hypothetical protein
MDIEYDLLAQDIMPGDNALKSVAKAANSMQALARRVAVLELHLKLAKEEFRTLQEQTLPDLMTEVGLSEFTLADGTAVEIKPIVDCTLPKERSVEGCDWLVANGHEGVVTTEIVLRFARGRAALVEQVIQHLRKIKLHAAPEYRVHPQTLKKLYRELTEQGQTLPDELFNTYHGRKALLKEAR